MKCGKVERKEGNASHGKKRGELNHLDICCGGEENCGIWGNELYKGYGGRFKQSEEPSEGSGWNRKNDLLEIVF